MFELKRHRHLRISLILILFAAQSVMLSAGDSGPSGRFYPQYAYKTAPSPFHPSATVVVFRPLTDYQPSESVPPSNHDSDSESSSSHSTDTVRHRRDTDDLLKNAQAISRIVSGAALEIGLMDGSISPRKAVSELLRMGTVTSEAIGKLYPGSVDTVMANLKALPDETEEMKPFEDWLVTLDYVRQNSDFMETFSKFSGKKEYEESLAVVQNFKVDLKKFTTDVPRLRSFLSELMQYSEKLTDEEFKDVDENYKPIHTLLEKMEGYAISMQTTIDYLKKVKKLEQHANFLDLLYKEKDLRVILPRLDGLGNVVNVGENLKVVHSSHDNLQKSEPLMKILQELIQARSPSFDRSFQYTSGLPNGPDDLKELIEDSRHPWVGAHLTNHSLILTNLEQVFKSFDYLATALTSVEVVWKRIETEQDLRKVVDAYFNAIDLKIDPQVVSDALEKIKDCTSNLVDPIADMKPVDDLKPKIDDLNQKVAKLGTLEGITQFKDLTKLKNIVTVTGTFDKRAAQQMVAALKNEPMFKTLLGVMNQLESDVTVIEKSKTELPQLANSILDDYKVIGSYFYSVNRSPNIELYSCVKKNVGNKTSDIKEAVLKLQKSRVNDQIISNAKSAIEKIRKTKFDLETVGQFAENLKSLDFQAAKAMKHAFNDHKRVAHDLGKAVQGLTAIQTAFDSKIQLNPLLENIDSIVKASNALPLKSLSKDHQENIKKLSNLKNTFSGIEEYQATLTSIKNQNPRFRSLQQVFEASSKVPDFSVDLQPIKKALDALNSVTKNQYKDARTAMDILKTLDLKFSKYKMVEPIFTLIPIEEFFTMYEIRLNASTSSSTPPKPPTTNPPPTRPPPVRFIACGGTDDHIVLKLVWGSVIIGILVMVAMFALVVHCLDQKKKKE